MEIDDQQWVKKNVWILRWMAVLVGGRPRKSWLECGNDMKKLGLRRDIAHDRIKWRSAIHENV